MFRKIVSGLLAWKILLFLIRTLVNDRITHESTRSYQSLAAFKKLIMLNNPYVRCFHDHMTPTFTRQKETLFWESIEPENRENICFIVHE